MSEYMPVQDETRDRIVHNCKPYFVKHREMTSQIAVKKQRLRELNKEAKAAKKDPEHVRAIREEHKRMWAEIEGIEDKMDEFMILGNVCIAKEIKDERPPEPYESD